MCKQRQRPLRGRTAGCLRRWLGSADAEPLPVNTTLSIDTTRTIIARNNSPDIGFNRSINPYRGCEHGCIYCYARPRHAYLGLSPGLDFESRLFYKPQAATLLAAELRKKGYLCRPIALGSNTDPYQPVERRLGITRSILEVLRDFRHPVTIVSKSALIRRDIDILSEMAKQKLAIVTISVTTLDRNLARVMEPPRPPPKDGSKLSPRLPTPAFRQAAQRPDDPGAQRQRNGGDPRTGARRRGHRGRLHLAAAAARIESAVPRVARTHFPDRAAHVLSLVAQAHGGRLYNSAWSKRMTGAGPYADMLRVRFDRACRKLGFNRRTTDPLDTTRFRPPPQSGGDQLSLFLIAHADRLALVNMACRSSTWPGSRSPQLS